MRKIIISAAVFLLLLPFIISAVKKTPDDRVYRVRDHQVISFGQMISEIKQADVVLLGETHNSMADHSAQLDIIKRLHSLHVPFSIGLEMFRADSQKDLDGWVKKEIPPDRFLEIYYDNWDAPWALYKDIFLFARASDIPMAGLNVPWELSGKIFTSGFNSLTPEEKKEIPGGITCTVDKEYERFIRQVYQVHHGMGGKSFDNFCQAQMLWDSVMAWNIVNRLRKEPGNKMVVLTGIGHAWKKGIPAQMGKRSKYRYAVVLPQLPMGKPDREISPDEADYILMGR
ncbi:MAG: ChaN family lipoprotein [Nitrospiraceae bacterium]|nr:ChaN family lipoprotein [Nitrospiraceae bacterium]